VLGVRLVVADGQARGGGTVPCPACAMPRLIAQAGIGAEYLTDGKPGVIRHFDPATLADTTPLRMVQQERASMSAETIGSLSKGARAASPISGRNCHFGSAICASQRSSSAAYSAMRRA
jgi:hypothetical protein